MARAQGIAEDLPRKAPKPVRPQRFGAAFWLQDAAGHVLLRRRPPQGLLGGMLELPGTPWRADPWPEAEAMGHVPQLAVWRMAGQAAHGFTHFALALDVYAAVVETVVVDGLLRDASALDGDTPDALRICPRDRAQDVTKLVDDLKEHGNVDLI